MDVESPLATNERQALMFFIENLRDTVEDGDAPRNEVFYNASVLAHYAVTSTTSFDFPRAPATLEAVFDLFVLDSSGHTDPAIMEAAASQCLLLTGFFGAQLKHRHNVDWFASLGAAFYARAAFYGGNQTRRAMMTTMSVRFGFWRRQQARLARQLDEQSKVMRYLFKFGEG